MRILLILYWLLRCAVCLFLLSPKTIPKTGVKTKQITTPEEAPPPRPPWRTPPPRHVGQAAGDKQPF